MYTSIQLIWGIVVISPHMLLHRLANIRKKEAITIYIDPMPSIIRSTVEIFIHANFHVSFSFGFHNNVLPELITISNIRSERVNENITTLCTCQQ